jgi:hypothetical protein
VGLTVLSTNPKAEDYFRSVLAKKAPVKETSEKNIPIHCWQARLKRLENGMTRHLENELFKSPMIDPKFDCLRLFRTPARR